MAFTVYNFTNNDDVKILHQMGQFQVIQWNRDLSVAPGPRRPPGSPRRWTCGAASSSPTSTAVPA